MWLILIGLILIGIAGIGSLLTKWRRARPAPVVPREPNSIGVYVLYACGAAMFGVAVYLFFSVANQTGYNKFAYFAMSVALVIAGVKLCKAGYEFQQKYALNMKAYAEAMSSRVQHERNKIELENARRKAQEQAELDASKRALELKRLETDRRLVNEEERTRIIEHMTKQAELELRHKLTSVGEEYGLDVDGVVDVNKHRYKSDIDLNARAAKTKQDLDAADRLDSTQQRQIINQLRAELEGLLRKRSQTEKEEKDEFVRERLLARYDKDIENLEAEIDARGARLVSSEDGQETRRLAAAPPDSRADSGPEVEAGEKFLPTPQRRRRSRW